MGGFNGAGTYARFYNWAQDKVNAIRIRADRMDTEMDGVATALSNVICRDGQSTIAANIPMNSKKLTGLAAGTASGDSLRYEQLFAGTVDLGTSAVLALGTVELGHATDTTLSRISAGVVGVEGAALATVTALSAVQAQLGEVLLASGSASGATLDINLSAFSGYRAWRVVVTNLRPATDNVQLFMRTSTNGGAAYDAGASDYQYSTWVETDPTGTSESGTTGYIALNPASVNVGNVVDEAASLDLIFYSPESAGHSKIQGQMIYKNIAGSVRSTRTCALRAASANVDAIRFLFSSGNITSGSYAIYGLR